MVIVFYSFYFVIKILQTRKNYNINIHQKIKNIKNLNNINFKKFPINLTKF